MSLRKTILSLAVLLAGFVPLALAQGTYTQIDEPDAALGTEVLGINTAGDLVGCYGDANNRPHGFLLSGGLYTSIDVAGVDTETCAFGINDLGQIVGYSFDHIAFQVAGFLYDVQNKTFTTITRSGNTFLSAINNAGTIVGYTYYTVGNCNCPIAFEYVGGVFHNVRPHGYDYSALSSINNFGEALGSAGKLLGTTTDFMFSQEHFHRVGIPVRSTVPVGINDQNTIVGYYFPPPRAQGFIYQNGIFQSLAFPDATATFGSAINNSGEVVGYFRDAKGRPHGFLWTPPADTAKE